MTNASRQISPLPILFVSQDSVDSTMATLYDRTKRNTGEKTLVMPLRDATGDIARYSHDLSRRAVARTSPSIRTDWLARNGERKRSPSASPAVAAQFRRCMNGDLNE